MLIKKYFFYYDSFSLENGVYTYYIRVNQIFDTVFEWVKNLRISVKSARAHELIWKPEKFLEKTLDKWNQKEYNL